MEKSKSNIAKLENFSAKQLDSDQTYYLLLEGDLNKNLYDEMSAIEFKVKKLWLYEDTEHDDEKEHGPLLVELDDANKHLEYFVEHWVKQHMGVAIGTKATTDELVQHLLDLRYVTIPDRDPKHQILFRWYEPRQLFGLLSSLDDKQTAYFMNNISSIIWCEWAHNQGIWYKKIKPETKENPAFKPYLHLEQETLDALAKQDEDFFIRQTTRELIDEYPALMEKGDEKSLNKAIKKQTKLAISQKIDRRNDIKEFIYNNLDQN